MRASTQRGNGGGEGRRRQSYAEKREKSGHFNEWTGAATRRLASTGRRGRGEVDGGNNERPRHL